MTGSGNADISEYLYMIKDIQIISDDEEKRLFTQMNNRANADDSEYARQKIFESYLPLVVKLSRTGWYKRRKSNVISIDDLIQEGNQALFKAIDSFDVSGSVKFLTYAYKSINLAIANYYRENMSSVSSTRYSRHQAEELRKAIKSLTANLERKPSIAEISEYMNLDENRVLSLLQTDFSQKSLNDPVNENEEGSPDNTVENIIGDPNSESFVNDFDLKEQERVFEYLCTQLTEQEVKILKLLHGYDCEKCSIAEAGRILSLPRTTVSSKYRAILKKSKTILSGFSPDDILEG